jgi:hypothetical protein
MRRWIAHALLLTIWVGLVGFITWLDRGGLYILYGSLPSWLTQGIYFLLVVVLLLWLRAVLGSDYLSRFHRGVLAFCIIWMMILPLIPWTSEKALMRDAARIQIGMTKAQVQAILAGYRWGKSGFYHAEDIEGLAFCADDLCETSAQVQFAAERVVRVWVDTD